MTYKKVLLIISILSIFVTSISFLPQEVNAADIRIGKEGEDITIDEYIDDDLYTSGNKVVINDDISGDLSAAGSEILINDDIYGNAILIGGTITIKGDVRGNLLVVGGLVSIQGDIGEDATIFAANMDLTGSVQDDARFVGGTFSISSIEIGDDLIVSAASGNVSESTEVGGDKQITIGQSTQNLSNYFTERVLTMSGFNLVTSLTKFLKAIGVILGWIIVGSILLKLFPKQCLHIIETISNKKLILKSSLYGLGFFICLLIIVPILFGLSFIGIGKPLFSVFSLSTSLAISVSGILGSWGIAKLLIETITKKEIKRNFLLMIIGVILYNSLALLSFICCFGCLSIVLKVILSVIGVGGMILSIKKKT